eukprot:TRINITY_DN98434_c0_g1_i1.p3 TRINITY_DN98434_c0_g1~~TRINITY_DN98434_c0_g1_i1.p3  ORF type:complete len:100 (+),score=12.63 TRINITY_DN98434_c0_g1_i1:3-302(+)
MSDQTVVESIRRQFDALRSLMDERSRRRWAATEALELGWGGVTAVAHATRLSRTTITQGLRELQSAEEDRPPDGGGADSATRRRTQGTDTDRPTPDGSA